MESGYRILWTEHTPLRKVRRFYAAGKIDGFMYFTNFWCF